MKTTAIETEVLLCSTIRVLEVRGVCFNSSVPYSLLNSTEVSSGFITANAPSVSQGESSLNMEEMNNISQRLSEPKICDQTPWLLLCSAGLDGALFHVKDSPQKYM